MCPPPGRACGGGRTIPSHSRDAVPSYGPGSLLQLSLTSSCSKAQALVARTRRSGKERGGGGQDFASSRWELGEVPPSFQASMSSPLKSNRLDDDNDCFCCWLLCARHFRGNGSPTPQNNPRRKEDPGLRVVKPLSHTAFQEGSKNSNSPSSESRA